MAGTAGHRRAAASAATSTVTVPGTNRRLIRADRSAAMILSASSLGGGR